MLSISTMLIIFYNLPYAWKKNKPCEHITNRKRFYAKD